MLRALSPFLVLFLLCGCNDSPVSSADSHAQEPPPAGDAPPPEPDPPPANPPSADPPPAPPDASPPDVDAPPPEPVDPPAVSATVIDPDQVADAITRAADWQLANPVEHDPRRWMMGALYSGLISASEATAEPRFLAAVLRAGERIDFILGSRTYHADGHAPGHAWLSIYTMDPERNPDMLLPFIEQFDEIVENPILEDISFSDPLPPGIRRTDRWTWSDALYMSPPTITMLAKATGDERYLEFMDAEYRFAYDALYDEEAHLFYRDSRYFDDRTPNGEKLFWSRGNGWVYAGLALVLADLPQDWPNRGFYLELFVEMTDAIVAAQQSDGFWYLSLLDPASVLPTGETSGTAFFVFGLAFGVREGILDPAVYWPAVEAGWSALSTIIDADGAVNLVQPIGDVPEVFDPDSRETYGTGAFLLAGAEILRALGTDEDIDPAALLERADELMMDSPDLSTGCEWTCAW